MKRNQYTSISGRAQGLGLRSVMKASLGLLLMGTLGSCSDLLDTDSELVEFVEDNRLNTPEDSVYSVMGIISKMQVIADRTLLLGELRGDLLVPTANAGADLKAISSLTIGADNPYNNISDYYAIINNCNYFLTTADTTLKKRNRSVFEREYAAVKAYRAWTYFEAAKVYGSIPLVTTPVLTESEARAAMNQAPVDMKALCDYFVNDLTPYVDTDLPAYGVINSQNSKKFFIPVRVLLGDLCLWGGRYQEAAQFYHDYLTKVGEEVTTGTNRVAWNSRTTDFKSVSNGYTNAVTSSGGSEVITYIPMESTVFDGVKSNLPDYFNSINANNYYFQVEPSKRIKQLSAAEDYCMEYVASDTRRDTLFAPKDNLLESYQEGDLRLYANYQHQVVNQQAYSRYSSDRQTLRKLNADGVTLYRVSEVYLHFAEALNRAGYPQSALAVLKYGLYPEMITTRIDSVERDAAGSLLDFSQTVFTRNNTQGIHSRGCGDSPANNRYVLPQPATRLESRADTVDYQIPLVEDMIVRELALETAFEGRRFYDLMRVALRRNDPAYLANPISIRNGERDENIYQKLSNTANWYLPKE